jgi:hypothetical protein
VDNPAAWHPDPTGRHDHRWWDGERWTEHVADAGVAGVDHLDTLPGPGETDTQRVPRQPTSDEHGRVGPGAGAGIGTGAGSGTDWSQGGSARRPTGTGVDGVALAAMIVGILSLLIAWVPFLGILGGLGGVVAVILGFVGRGRARANGQAGSGQALTGIVTGAVALVLSIAVTVGFARLIGGDFGEVFSSYAECVEETGDEDLCRRQLEDDLFRR